MRSCSRSVPTVWGSTVWKSRLASTPRQSRREPAYRRNGRILGICGHHAAGQENSKFSGLHAPATSFIGTMRSPVSGCCLRLRRSFGETRRSTRLLALAREGGLAATQHSCQIARQRDLQLVAVGLEQDRLDERSNGVRRARAALSLSSARELPTFSRSLQVADFTYVATWRGFLAGHTWT